MAKFKLLKLGDLQKLQVQLVIKEYENEKKFDKDLTNTKKCVISEVGS
jgi:hypothetical protein